MLCCGVPCRAVPCRAVLCCAALTCVVLLCVVICNVCGHYLKIVPATGDYFSTFSCVCGEYFELNIRVCGHYVETNFLKIYIFRILSCVFVCVRMCYLNVFCSRSNDSKSIFIMIFIDFY